MAAVMEGEAVAHPGGGVPHGAPGQGRDGGRDRGVRPGHPGPVRALPGGSAGAGGHLRHGRRRGGHVQHLHHRGVRGRGGGGAGGEAREPGRLQRHGLRRCAGGPGRGGDHGRPRGERGAGRDGDHVPVRPVFHSAMRHAAPVRRELGVRTIFNLLGPLCNPAGAGRPGGGRVRRELVRPVAEAWPAWAPGAPWWCTATDGLDELTVTGPRSWRSGTAPPSTSGRSTRELGLVVRGVASFGAVPRSTTPGSPAAFSATPPPAANGGLPTGADAGAARDVVLLNAAAALVVAGAGGGPPGGAGAGPEQRPFR
jgi:hypothetical protein